MPFYKPKRPEIVRWVEPSALRTPISKVFQENGNSHLIT